MRAWHRELSFVTGTKSSFPLFSLKKVHCNKNLPQQTPFSPDYLQCRQQILDWIEQINIQMGHQTQTFYRSVKIIDQIFSLIDINMPQ